MSPRRRLPFGQRWEDAHVLRALLAMPQWQWDRTWADHVTTELEITTWPHCVSHLMEAALARIDWFDQHDRRSQSSRS